MVLAVSRNIPQLWYIIPVKLPTASPKPNIGPSVNEEESNMSGINMESPHKDIAAAQEFPCNIPVIGDICTSWIDRKGI